MMFHSHNNYDDYDDDDNYRQPAHCRNCGRSETSDAPLSQCGTCGGAVYCSMECQKADWPHHKTVCNQRAGLLLLWAMNNELVEDSEDPTKTTLHQLMRHKRVVNVKLLSYLPPGERNCNSDNNNSDEGRQFLHGWTPLHECVRLQNVSLLNLLLENGALVNEVDDNNETPLYVASSLPSSELVKRLLEAGADPNICAHNGWSPLMMATREGYHQNVKLLLEYGAKQALGRDTTTGQGAREIAVQRAKEHAVRIHPSEYSIETEENSLQTYEIFIQHSM